MSITHKFVSAVADDGDATKVRPINWNDTHVTGHPDDPPSSPSSYDDEFNSLTGWSTLGTLDISNVTDFPGRWHAKRTASGDGVNGIYKACPSIPFTVTTKLSGVATSTSNPLVGIMLLDSTPTALWTTGIVPNSGFGAPWYDFGRAPWTNRTTRGSFTDSNISGLIDIVPTPFWFKVVVNSSSNVDVKFSVDGYFYQTVYTAVNPGITVANVGLTLTTLTGACVPETVFDYIRFT